MACRVKIFWNFKKCILDISWKSVGNLLGWICRHPVYRRAHSACDAGSAALSADVGSCTQTCSLLHCLSGDSITYRQWSELIKQNFEKHFYVDANPSSPDTRRDLINRRGMYKDTVGATAPWTDYQLRPNFPIALAVVCSIHHAC